MPKEEGQITEPEEEPQTGGEDQNQDGGANGEEQFDKDRALETIRKQRESEARLAKELKAAQARLKALDDAEKARLDAEKSEAEKALARASELEQQLKAAQEVTQALRLRGEFGKVAAKQGFKFASVQAEDDAFDLADFEGVEIDDNGKVTGLESALKDLQKTRPYLFAQEREPGDGNGTPRRPSNNSNGKLNQDAIKKPLVKL